MAEKRTYHSGAMAKERISYQLFVRDASTIELNGSPDHNRDLLDQAAAKLKAESIRIVDLLNMHFKTRQFILMDINVTLSGTNVIELRLSRRIDDIDGIIKGILDAEAMPHDCLFMEDLRFSGTTSDDAEAEPAMKAKRRKKEKGEGRKKKDDTNVQDSKSREKYREVYTPKFPTSGRVIRKPIVSIEE